MNQVHKKRMTTFQLIVMTFFCAILAGTLLLSLPIASANHQSAGFMDALFTSTSAVCVTGLVVRDTATAWSTFGKTIILILIQIGGIGVVTIAAMIAIVTGRKIGLMQRSLLKDAVSAPQIGGVVSLTKFIVQGVALIEAIGACLLMPAMIREFGVAQGIPYAIFHSISAFCNAGFDLMGVKAQYSSLASYSNDATVNLTIMALIIIGGIGFLTWEDIIVNKLNFRRYRVQSKIILITTAVLILVPAILFFFLEFASFSMKERILLSLFQSVTTRTAGFNTADLTKMSESGQFLMIVLMLIGGSPGSTAGGMKTTTAAVLAMWVYAGIKRKAYPQGFGRRIEKEVVGNATLILMIYLVLFIIGGLTIARIEELPLTLCLFEVASALGTVGLTLGITPGLSVASRLILILFMFIGRVGGLTLAYAASRDLDHYSKRLPSAKVMVG